MPRVWLLASMPLFRTERPENAPLWLGLEKGVYQLSISPFRGHEKEREPIVQANQGNEKE